MSYNEISWDYPLYSGYSILNAAVNPAVLWNTLQNNPFVQSFEVWYLDIDDNSWIEIGTTTANYIRFPADQYNAQSTYQVRIATIGVNGTRSPFSYSTVVLSSPLAFNFTTDQTVRLISGAEVPNQRFLFLVF
jgi:hypothetical protein